MPAHSRRPVVVDLFAGAGGFSEGAKMAGCQVAWAANHWELAVKYHAANHPGTDHKCQDLHQADWSEVPEHDILLASPACQGHSRARGRERPHHDAQRATAWAVVSCCEYRRPPFVVVENVREFLSWSLYPSWADALQRLGYTLTPHVIDAADHGVPQNRRRVFIVCALDDVDLRLPQRQHVPARAVIDLDGYRWSKINKPGRSPTTLWKIDNGRRDHGDLFVMPFYGNTHTGRSMERPLGTVTTRDRWAVIHGDKMRMLQPAELRAAMGFPASYQLPPNKREAVHLMGNAVCPPVARDIIDALFPERSRASIC